MQDMRQGDPIASAQALFRWVTSGVIEGQLDRYGIAAEYETVAISDIDVDFSATAQPRIDSTRKLPEYIEAYANQMRGGNPFIALIGYRKRNRKYALVDGNQRVQAAIDVGAKSVQMYVMIPPTGNPEDDFRAISTVFNVVLNGARPPRAQLLTAAVLEYLRFPTTYAAMATKYGLPQHAIEQATLAYKHERSVESLGHSFREAEHGHAAIMSRSPYPEVQLIFRQVYEDVRARPGGTNKHIGRPLKQDELEIAMRSVRNAGPDRQTQIDAATVWANAPDMLVRRSRAKAEARSHDIGPKRTSDKTTILISANTLINMMASNKVYSPSSMGLSREDEAALIRRMRTLIKSTQAWLDRK